MKRALVILLGLLATPSVLVAQQSDASIVDSDTEETEEQDDDVATGSSRTTLELGEIPADQAVPTEVLTASLLEEMGATNLEEALRLSGSAGAGESNGRGLAVIDGLPSSFVDVRIDGLPAHRATSGQEGVGVDLSSIPIDPDQIERIEIHRGIGPAGSGGASGVVVNVITREPSDEWRLRAEGTLAVGEDTFPEQSAEVGVEGPVAEEITFGTSATWDHDTAVDVNGDGTFDLPTIDQFTGGADLSWSPNNNEGIDTSIDVTRTMRQVLGSTDGPQIQRFATDGASVTVGGQWWLGNYDARLEHSTRVGWFERSYATEARDTGTRSLRTQTQEWNVHQNLLSTVFVGSVDVIGELEYRHTSLERSGALLDPLAVNEDIGGAGLGARVPVSERWTFESRFFGDVHSGFGAGFNAQGALHFEATDHLSLRVSGARGRRAPLAEERFLFFDHSEVGYQIQGNPDLEPEHIVTGRFGFAITNTDVGYGFDVEGFVHRIDDHIVTEQLAIEPGAPALFTYSNAARVLTAGSRLSAQLTDIAGLTVRVSYSWLPLASDLETSERLVLRPYHGVDLLVSRSWFGGDLRTWVRMDGRSALNVPEGAPEGPGFVTFDLGASAPIVDGLLFRLEVDNLLNQTNATWGPKPGLVALAGLSLELRP